MKRVLWVSRHTPEQKQIAALQAMFGHDTEVVQDQNSFSSAEDIAERYRNGGYDDMVVVAPLSVIDHLTRQGIYLLYSQMDQVKSAKEADFSYRNRHFKFNRFRRIKEVRIVFEDQD